MRILLVAAVFLCLNFITEKTWGWGETGHRTVGQIAENHLTPIAKAKIQSILGAESLAQAATWADEVRSDHKFEEYDPWHYVEIPTGMTYETAPKNPKGDIIVGVQSMMDVLQGNSTKFKPKEALRYLIHFIGDLHQPMHVGDGSDHGGNLCTVKFAGRNTNLHVIWDSGLIDARNLSFTEYADFLDRADLVTPAKIRKWTAGNFILWAEESGKRRDSLYPPNNRPRAKAPAYFEEARIDLMAYGLVAEKAARNYCKTGDGESIPTALIPQLGFAYEYKFKNLLDEQLTKAGIRLSSVLNDLFQ